MHFQKVLTALVFLSVTGKGNYYMSEITAFYFYLLLNKGRRCHFIIKKKSLFIYDFEKLKMSQKKYTRQIFPPKIN